MKKGLFGVLALALAVVVITVAVMLTLKLDYEKSKPAANSSEAQSSEATSSNSQSEPSTELSLGVYAELLTTDYYDERFSTFICIKDIDGDGVDELLLKEQYGYAVDVFTYKNGVLRVGKINSFSSSLYYECETVPGICRVVTENNICYYSTIKDGLLVEEQVWYQTVDVSEDENLVQETRNAYGNNTALEFEVLSSFPEIQQAIDNHWYYKITRSTNWWSQKVVYGGQNFYYIADDGLYRYDFSGRDTKLIDGKIGGLWYDGQGLYYSTETTIECYDPNYNNTTTFFDLSEVKGLDVSEGIVDFKMHGDYIYIMNTATSAFRYNLETKKAEMFLDDFTTAVFGDDFCYYIDHADETFSVYSIDYETLETKLVAGEGVTHPEKAVISSVYVINNELYYYERVTEKTYRLDGSVLFYGNPEVIQGHDGKWVYSAVVQNGKVEILKNTYGAVLLVTKFDAADIVDGHYIVTEKATFTIPKDPNQKISMVWY